MPKTTELSPAFMEPMRIHNAKLAGFLATSALPVVFIWLSMRSLATITLRNDTYSHIPLIPIISLFLIYSERQRIFSRVSTGWKIGSPLVLVGLLCLAAGEFNSSQGSSQNSLSLAMAGVVLAWTGSFAWYFGESALRAASFPFLFLIFMIPIPEPVLSRTIMALQHGSADAASWFFSMIGIPVLRQGIDFVLPGIVIRVAEECSGIRSTLALVIMAVLAGHMFLQSFLKKTFLCLLVFPVSIIKNGLRIATLSALAVYVNPGFLHGRLHQYGGIVFFAAGLVPLALALAFLQKTEVGARKNLEH